MLCIVANILADQAFQLVICSTHPDEGNVKRKSLHMSVSRAQKMNVVIKKATNRKENYRPFGCWHFSRDPGIWCAFYIPWIEGCLKYC